MRKLLDVVATADCNCGVALVYTAAVLTAFEYFFIPTRVEAWLHGVSFEVAPAPSLRAGLIWSIACLVGYVLIPLAFVHFLHRDSLSNVGFRLKGFGRHVWVYLALFALMLPVVVVVSENPLFRNTYPFVPAAREQLGVFLLWEFAYVVQFFTLEAFFRGYLLFTLEKRFGASAVFVMVVPYAMLHFHKPALEAFGAIAAGIILGFLALRFRSWAGGALLHSLVAVTMDTLAVHKARLF